MWNKSSFVVARFGCNHLRLYKQIHTCLGPSHLRNSGSEPLVSSTLGDVINQTVNKYPDRVAIRSVPEDLTITYGELQRQADKLGCALRAQGLEKGDRVGIWSHNNAAFIVAMVAAARVGLIPVLLNPVYEAPELSFSMKKTGIKTLFIGDKIPNRDYYSKVLQLVPELQTCKPGSLKSQAFPQLSSVFTLGKEELAGTSSIHRLISEYSDNEITKYSSEVRPEDGSIIHLTSGTTGDPKAALASHKGLVNNTYFVGKRFQLHEGEHRVCVQAPFFHALGSVVTTLGSFRHGSSLVLASYTYNVVNNLNAMISEKCTVITGTPTMYVDMLSEARKKGGVPSQLQVALAAGAPCSPQVIRDMQQYLKTKSVQALYGLTEATACITQSQPGDSTDLVAETVGYITDGTEVKVVDEKGKQVPFGSPGELLSRGYNNMIGYWDDPEKTRSAIDADGWVHTGDILTLSEDGYGRIVGRLKDIIVKGGENIAPKEIEDLLNTHPDIIESQVVGVADDRLGEDLCAVLRVRDNATVTAADVASFMQGKLARFKIPKLVKITPEYPKTISGKIQKFKLKKIIESGQL